MMSGDNLQFKVSTALSQWDAGKKDPLVDGMK